MNSQGPDGGFLLDNLKKTNGAFLITQGRKAFKNIPGLKMQYLKGVLLTFILITALFYAEYALLYEPLLVPWLQSYSDQIIDWWSWLEYIIIPIMWLIKLICWMIMLIIALKLAVTLMGFWIDTLIEKVIQHHRSDADISFSLFNFFKSTGRSIILTSKNLVLAVFMLILGFIPIIGIAFGFIGAACTNGFDIVSPYILLRAERNPEILQKFKMKGLQTFKAGWVQAFLTYIPVIGWFFLPFVLLLQIIGYAYYIENAWKNTTSQPA